MIMGKKRDMENRETSRSKEERKRGERVVGCLAQRWLCGKPSQKAVLGFVTGPRF